MVRRPLFHQVQFVLILFWKIISGRLDLAVPFTPSTPYRQEGSDCLILTFLLGVFSEGVQLCQRFFLVDEGIQIPLKAGHHRPASVTPFK